MLPLSEVLQHEPLLASVRARNQLAAADDVVIVESIPELESGAPAPFIRSAYNYDTDKASQLTALHCDDESLAQQHLAEEVDINTIVRRFGLTGELPDKYQAPVFADFEGVFDYQTALHAVIEGDRAFMEMPAKLRARFQNDPQELMEFLADPANREEATKLGLLASKPDVPGPTPTPAPPEPPEPV